MHNEYPVSFETNSQSSSQGPVLERSTYDRSAMKTGVVHIGVGAFHRAHQATYFDSLMELTGDLNWGITGVNLRPGQSVDADRLNARGGEYVLKLLPPDNGPEYRLVRSIMRVLDWTQDPGAAESIIADASVQIVTVTVTESGYCKGQDDRLDLANAEIRNELAGKQSTTVYAYLRNALAMRMAAGGMKLTVLCCDNIRENGTMLERNLLTYLDTRGDTELARWVGNNVSFPCSMVDRITPRPVSRTSGEIERLFGIGNDYTVHTEDFIQWVLEDNFRSTRPDLDKVGVQVVEDVHPYEMAKIRILNGGHVSIAYLGALLGHETFDTAIRMPELSTAFDNFANNEAIPVLGQDSPVDLPEYARQVKRRFRNRNIADSIARITMDGVSKFQIFITPTVSDCYDMGIVPSQCLRGIASWYVLMCHVRAGTTDFDYVDPLLDIIEDHLQSGGEEAFARNAVMWGDIPARHPRFVDDLATEISCLIERFPD